MNKLFTKIATAFVGIAMAIGVGVAVASNREAVSVYAENPTYTFTNKSWADSTNSWTSDNEGVGMDGNNRGVQVSAGKTGGAHSKSSFSNITNISIVASQASGGSATVGVKVGSGQEQTTSVSKSSTKTCSFDFNSVSGVVTFRISPTTKSGYIKSITVTYSSGTSYTTTVSVTGGAKSTTNTSTSFSSTTKSGDVYLTPSKGYRIPTSGLSTSFNISSGTATISSITNNGDGDVKVSLTGVSSNFTIGGSFELIPTHTITYVKGDHGSGSNYVVSSQPEGSYTLVSLATAGFIADSGYGFKKWNVGGTEYDPGDSITLSADITVTAVWAEVVTLTYDKNGGTGTNSSSQVAKGSTVTVADNSFTAPSGKEFSKWNTKSDGTGTSYVKDDTFTINADTTLFAQWSPVLDITLSNWNNEDNVITAITNNYTTTAETLLPVATYNSTSTIALEGYGVYMNSPNIQMNSGRGTYIKNTEALPVGAYITKIVTVWGGTSTQQSNATPKIYMSKGSEASTSSTLVATGTGGANQTWTVSNASTCGYNYFYFDGGDNLGGACYLTSMKICYDFNDEVRNIAVNATQAQLTFTVGDTFTFAGSVTPTRLISGVGSATTENLTFKLGGTTITAGSYTFVKADDGKTLNVTYTENGKSVSANAPYNVIVDYAYIESVSISTKTPELGKLDSFTFGAEVLPSNAQQDVTWSVEDKVGTEVESGNIVIDKDTGELTVVASDGCTITVTATTVGEDENGDTLTDSVDVVITGDPVVVVDDALAGYSGKNTSLAYSFNNFTGTLSVVSSDTNKVTVGTPSATTGGSGSGTVQVNFVAAGSSTLSFKDGDSVIATCVITVTASAVESVSWTNSSNMTVYSGSTALNAAKITEWAPQYTMNNEDSGSITGDYTIQLNGSAYSLGTALEAGTYTVTLTYGGKTTASSNPVVTVIQSLNTITYDDSGKYSYDAAYADFNGKGSSSGEAITLNGVSWTFKRDGSNTYSATGGIPQIGTGSTPETFSLSTTGIEGTIKKVSVSGASKSDAHTLSISVGGTSYYSGNLSSWTTIGTKSGTGTKSGEIIITFTKGSGAAYLSKIEVEWESSKNIANNTSHYDAQAKVVEFAQYMNEQMNGTKVCTDDMANLGTAWGKVAAKYDELFGDGEYALQGTELEYAQKMLKNASAFWNEEHDSDEKYCLERAMKTYEWCTSHYSSTCTPFMFESDGVTPLRSINVSEGFRLFNIQNSSTILIVSVVSLVSVAAVGGYFFLRKKKED